MSMPYSKKVRTYYDKPSTQPLVAQLQELTAVLSDGDVSDKKSRDELFKRGFINRHNGWNFITAEGLDALSRLDFINH